jgi:hypothetical protein
MKPMLLFLLAALAAGECRAQSSAAIPGAKIRILHVATGVATHTLSNQDGYFSTPPLNIGNYRIRVEAPGMELDGAGLRTGGMMLYSTTYMQDGAASNNREFGGAANLQGLDSIGEVRVETSTSSAKYSSPASVIITTKSGSNRVSGTLYEILRNNAFGVARAWASPTAPSRTGSSSSSAAVTAFTFHPCPCAACWCSSRTCRPSRPPTVTIPTPPRKAPTWLSTGSCATRRSTSPARTAPMPSTWPIPTTSAAASPSTAWGRCPACASTSGTWPWSANSAPLPCCGCATTASAASTPTSW